MKPEARIMLVDDEQLVLNSLRRSLRFSGFDVTTCTSGAEALAVLEKSEPYNLVISDYRMPGMNGVEFLSSVRKRWPDTVRMVLSGFADSAAIIAATNEGNIYKFIPKPWDEDFLLQSVKDALELNVSNTRRTIQSQMLGEALENLGMLQADGLVSQSQVLSCYHSLLDQMPVGLVGIDSAGNIASMNELACQMLGLSIAPLGEAFAATLPALVTISSGTPSSTSENSRLSLNGRQIQVRVKHMNDDGMQGIILILVLLEE